MNPIAISGNTIHIKEWKFASKQVTESLAQLMDAPTNLSTVEALEALLKLGSEVLKLSSSSVEIERMSSIAQSLSQSLEQNSKETIDLIDQAVRKLVDPNDGSIAKAAKETVEKTRESISALFVGENAIVPREVSKKLDDKLDSFSKEMHRVISQASISMGGSLSLDSENSPLRALKSDILQTSLEMNKGLGEKLEQLRLKLEALETRKVIVANTTKKGLPFEQAVFEMITQIATASGDEALRTGAITGNIKNCKKGDVLLTLNKSLTRDQSINIVIETKSMNLTREEWRRELETATLNRGAELAIAVVQNIDQMPNKSRISITDSKQLFVAFDPDIDDPAVLMCVISFARATVIARQLQGTDFDQKIFHEVAEQLHGAMMNLDGIEGAVRSARTSLDRIESARVSIKTTVEFQVKRLAKFAEGDDVKVA